MIAQLTDRERQVLSLLAEGYTEHQIADLLGLARTTVRFHKDNLIDKLGARNTLNAISLAYVTGHLQLTA